MTWTSSYWPAMLLRLDGVCRRPVTYRGELSVGGSAWKSPDGLSVDVFEGSESWWPRALAAAATSRDQQGLPILPLPYLVLTKLLAGRVQDVADVARMLGYAREETLAQVRMVITTHQADLLEDLESLIALGRLETQLEQGQEP